MAELPAQARLFTQSKWQTIPIKYECEFVASEGVSKSLKLMKHSGSGFGGSAGLLSGLSADDLKVKFPVVICPVLTVYFLTYMLLCVPSSVLFQKSCYL